MPKQSPDLSSSSEIASLKSARNDSFLGLLGQPHFYASKCGVASSALSLSAPTLHITISTIPNPVSWFPTTMLELPAAAARARGVAAGPGLNHIGAELKFFR